MRHNASVVILTAAALALVLLLWIGIQNLHVPEWLTHLCISVVVVAIVHLLDRYVFMGETRDELNKMGNQIVIDVASSSGKALEDLTAVLTDTVTSRSSDLLLRTKQSLNDILTHQSSALGALEQSGILNVYASRRSASQAIAAALRSESTEDIRLLGISLNDFFRGDEKELHAVWQEIESCILDPSRRMPSRRLSIRFLMIDPRCHGANLRSFSETSGHRTTVGRLESDVLNAAEAMLELEDLVARRGSDAGAHVTFACRLYRLAPTMFLCHVDDRCFVQQYHFWTERINDTPIPVLEYGINSGENGYPMHSQLREHFELIWKHASESLGEAIRNASVGTESGAGHLALQNIFTEPDRAAERMRHLLANAKQHVEIQGISLKSFFTGGTPLVTRMLELIAAAEVPIRVLLLAPDCDQAVYRSYRELQLQPQGRGTTLEAYRQSGRHERSALFTNTEDTVARIRDWVAELEATKPGWNHKLNVRMYDSAPGCFLLAVDGHVLVEQYNYGKMGVRREGIAAPVTLGSDMPLMEYRDAPTELYQHVRGGNPLRNPYGLLMDHFDFAFQHAVLVDFAARTTSDPPRLALGPSREDSGRHGAGREGV